MTILAAQAAPTAAGPVIGPYRPVSPPVSPRPPSRPPLRALALSAALSMSMVFDSRRGGSGAVTGEMPVAGPDRPTEVLDLAGPTLTIRFEACCQCGQRLGLTAPSTDAYGAARLPFCRRACRRRYDTVRARTGRRLAAAWRATGGSTWTHLTGRGRP